MRAIAFLAVAMELLATACGPGLLAWEQAAPAKSRPAGGSAAAGLRFEKVSDHVYFLQPKADGANVAAVLSSEGFVLVDPPSEPALQPVLDALNRVAARQVKWVLGTDYLRERTGGSLTMLARGAALLASKELRELSSAGIGAKESPAEPAGKGAVDEAAADSGPRITFTRQMRLFPDGLEIRIIAIQHPARTSGDVMVFVPAEKVLITGEFFAGGSFPEIDADAGGSASGWIDGLKQAIEAVPLLKSAMPSPKPDPNKPPPEEKTLEEQVTVIPGQGPRTDLQAMKDLYEAAQKMRAEMTRAIGARRSRESILVSSALGQARFLDNFESFSARLFDELSARKPK